MSQVGQYFMTFKSIMFIVQSSFCQIPVLSFQLKKKYSRCTEVVYTIPSWGGFYFDVRDDTLLSNSVKPYANIAQGLCERKINLSSVRFHEKGNLTKSLYKGLRVASKHWEALQYSRSYMVFLKEQLVTFRGKRGC